MSGNAEEWRPNPATGYRGVYSSGGRWTASLWVVRGREGERGSSLALGSHDSPEEAALAWDAAARKRGFPERALNFPNGIARQSTGAEPKPPLKRTFAHPRTLAAPAAVDFAALDWPAELASGDTARLRLLLVEAEARKARRAAASAAAAARAALDAASAGLEAAAAADLPLETQLRSAVASLDRAAERLRRRALAEALQQELVVAEAFAAATAATAAALRQAVSDSDDDTDVAATPMRVTASTPVAASPAPVARLSPAAAACITPIHASHFYPK